MKKPFWASLFAILCLLLISCASTPYKELNRTPINSVVHDSLTNQIWYEFIGNGVGASQINLNPLVRANRVFVNSQDGTVVALNLKTGDKIWQLSFPAKFNISIGADSSRLFLADTTGIVRVVNKKDGKLLWQTETSSEISARIISDDNIMVVRSTNGKTEVFSIQFKERIWQNQHLALPFSLHGAASPIIFNNQIIVPTSNGEIISYHRQSGKKLWAEPITFPYGRTVMDRIVDVDAEPLIVGNEIYVLSMHGKLAKINLNTGNTIWSTNYSGMESPIIYENTIIVSHEDGSISGFNAQDGSLQWKNNQLLGYDLIGPIQFDNYFVIGVKNKNRVFWLDRQQNKITRQTIIFRHQSDFQSNEYDEIDYEGNHILSLTQTQQGVLIYTKDGNLSLHRP